VARCGPARRHGGHRRRHLQGPRAGPGIRRGAWAPAHRRDRADDAEPLPLPAAEPLRAGDPRRSGHRRRGAGHPGASGEPSRRRAPCAVLGLRRRRHGAAPRQGVPRPGGRRPRGVGVGRVRALRVRIERRPAEARQPRTPPAGERRLGPRRRGPSPAWISSPFRPRWPASAAGWCSCPASCHRAGIPASPPVQRIGGWS
jgi:hypothetical protein